MERLTRRVEFETVNTYVGQALIEFIKVKDINFQLLLNQSIEKYVQKMLEYAFIYDKQLVGIHIKLYCCQVSL